MTPDELEGSLAHRFAKIAAQHGERLAIVGGADALTYAELDRLSNRIAWAIAQRQGRASQPVAVLLRQGLWPLAAVHGIWKAGKFFVRLQGDEPPEMLAFKLNDLGKPLLITDSGNGELAASLAEHTCGVLRVDAMLAATPTEPVCVAIGPDQPALIEYTSGSTGRPKGVMSSQRTFLHRTYARIQQAHLSIHDRFTHLGPAYFYAALVASLAGATTFDVDLTQMDMGRVSQWLADSEITVLFCSATGFRQLVRSARRGLTYPHIRLVILTGEPPQPRDILAARGLFGPDCLFNNQYGGTECALVGSYFVNMATAARHLSLPAGYAPEGKELLLLDESGRRVYPPLGEEAVGEIAVRSRYLASGYWNGAPSGPERTQERFLIDPEGSDQRIYLTGDMGRIDRNGCLHFLGREDFQVKVRGYRVEPLQVEAALRAIDGIADAAVVARPGPNGDLRLIGYVVTTQERIAVTALRRLLGQHLPAAMIPAAFVFLDKLPLTSTHKLDRNALPEPGAARPRLEAAYIAPRTPMETAVARIWAEVLELEEVGVHDNFLDLGGDSLLASQVTSRVIERLAVEMPAHSLLEAPTVSTMTTKIVAYLARVAGNENLLS